MVEVAFAAMDQPQQCLDLLQQALPVVQTVPTLKVQGRFLRDACNLLERQLIIDAGDEAREAKGDASFVACPRVPCAGRSIASMLECTPQATELLATPWVFTLCALPDCALHHANAASNSISSGNNIVASYQVDKRVRWSVLPRARCAQL